MKAVCWWMKFVRKTQAITSVRYSSPMDLQFDRITQSKCSVSIYHPTEDHIIRSNYYNCIFLVPPTVSSYPSGNIRLRLGSIFEITCDATGVPHPIISWRRVHPSGAVEWLSENRRSYRVEITSRQMAGTYQCLANNGIEEPAVAGVNLHVNCRTVN